MVIYLFATEAAQGSERFTFNMFVRSIFLSKSVLPKHIYPKPKRRWVVNQFWFYVLDAGIYGAF